MKIALYKSYSDTSSQLIFEVTDWMEKNEGHVRVSEIMEVEFTPLPVDQTESLILKGMQKELDALELKREELQEMIAKQGLSND